MKCFVVLLLSIPTAVLSAAPDPTAIETLRQDMVSERRGHTEARKRVLKKLGALTRPDQDAARQRVWDEVADLNALHAAVMNDLLDRTMRLYNVYPSQRSGSVVIPGRLRGAAARWEPRFGNGEPVRHVQLASGRSVTLQTTAGYEAAIWVDGVVEITEEAFQSPGYLAAILLHESVHFDQLVTPGRGDRISAVRSELEAHSRSSSQQAIIDYGLSSAEAARLKRVNTSQMQAFQRNPGLAMMSMQFKDSADAREGAENGFDQSLGAAAPLAAPFIPTPPPAAAAPLQPAGPAAPSVDEVPSYGRAAPEARGYEYAPRDGAWQLRSLAIRACANPGAISENDFAPLSWFPTIRAITDASAASENLPPCAAAMYWELLRCDPHQPRPSSAWVNARASSLSSPPVAEEYIREPRTKSRGCIMRGVWFPDCY